MNTIKPIETRAVCQIQSGQVIVDLCSVAKELVENSLDAGATSIEVKFKNQGLDAIEVQDNGDGISPLNYETLGLKHHTSKLSNYSDLATLHTFGFRGEALSSLCALSRIKVTTCLAQDTPKGTKLEFETSGKLKSTSVVAAQKGTTVYVENLFSNLPVRRRELERNIRREWNKVLGVLGQYACIQTGVRFSVTQQTGNGKKLLILSTNGNRLTKENIANIFGAKTLTALIPLNLKLELQGIKVPSRNENARKEIRILGHISRLVSGEGRQIPDRQMFFLNSRPCNLPQIAKNFNEVYRSFNGPPSPFIFVNIELDTQFYDLNVSPDKRTILLHDQNLIIEALRNSLTEFFESQDNTIPMAQLPFQKQSNSRQLKITHGSSSDNLQEISDPSTPISRSMRLRVGKSPNIGNISQKPESPTGHLDPSAKELISKDCDNISLSLNLKQFGAKSSLTGLEVGESSLAKSTPTRNLDEKPKPIAAFHGKAEQERAASPTPEGLDFRNPSINSRASRRSLFNDFPDQEPFGQSDSKRQRMCSSAFTYSEEPASFNTPAKTPFFAKKFSMTPSNSQAHAQTAMINVKDQTMASSRKTPCPIRNRYGSDSPLWKKSSGLLDLLPEPLSSLGETLNENFSTNKTMKQASLSKDNVDEAYFSQKSPRLSECSDDNQYHYSESAETSKSDVELVTEEDTELLATQLGVVDDEYVDEDVKRVDREDKVQEMVHGTDDSAALPSREGFDRCKASLKRSKKDSTLNLVQRVTTDISYIKKQFELFEEESSRFRKLPAVKSDEALDSMQAEERLSLTISKSDFAKMRVIGQFNLGFIIVFLSGSDSHQPTGDNLFIIDQHASDEKYNFERLQAMTILQSQHLVLPKSLSLTALEEEIVMENLAALKSNGFVVAVDESGSRPVGSRCQLLSLPLSRETTFSLSDFEELVGLLVDGLPQGTAITRPSKVRKMLAMRACRSSIMIGRCLARRQMERVVCHLGELDKPWNCPHGRPTMRHLYGLGAWDGGVCKTGSAENQSPVATNWARFLRRNRTESTLSDDSSSSL